MRARFLSLALLLAGCGSSPEKNAEPCVDGAPCEAGMVCEQCGDAPPVCVTGCHVDADCSGGRHCVTPAVLHLPVPRSVLGLARVVPNLAGPISLSCV